MDATEQVATVKAMYRRVLAQWAQDVLILRAKGLDRPCWPRSSPFQAPELIVPPGSRARRAAAPRGKAA